MRILVLNPGSVTLKATVLDPPDADPRFNRTVTWLHEDEPDGRARTVEAVAREMAMLDDNWVQLPEAVVLDDAVVESIAALADLAPLHNPIAVDTIRAARRTLPGIPHVAAFDTAFHASLPEHAWRYALPAEWVERWGIRRFGFHGLSVAWSVRRAAGRGHRPVRENWSRRQMRPGWRPRTPPGCRRRPAAPA